MESRHLRSHHLWLITRRSFKGSSGPGICGLVCYFDGFLASGIGGRLLDVLLGGERALLLLRGWGGAVGTDAAFLTVSGREL